MRRSLARVIAFAGALLFTGPARAAPDAHFTPSANTALVGQPAAQQTSGTAIAGMRYRLLEIGGPDQAWCKLELNPGAGWMRCDAGVRDGTPAPVGKAKLGLGEFSYYALRLSWSPACCAGKKKTEACPKGCGFVVRALTPQAIEGGPESCGSPDHPDEALIASLLPIMPGRAAILQEWDVHGTCTLLKAGDYFETLREAYLKIKVPPALGKGPAKTTAAAIKKAFIAANPELTAEMIAISCREALSEVRICFDQSLAFRPCGADLGDACPGTTRLR